MDFEKLRISLEERLPRIRWWPWKNRRVDIILEYKRIIGDHVFLLFKAGSQFFYLPLRKIYCEANLPEERILEVNNDRFVEAEFQPDYIEALDRNSDVELDELTPLPGKPSAAEPLSLETTNIVSKVTLENNDALVVKSYRLLPVVEMEVQILRRLALEKYRHIPPLYRIYRLKGKTISIIMKFVQGHGDGGYPFWKASLEYFKDRSSSGGLRLGLASKLGVIIADLHKHLNKPVDKGFFGAEPIDDRDVGEWRRRLERRYSEILGLMDRNIDTLDKRRDISKADFWRQLFEEKGRVIVENAGEYMELYRGKAKARIHQDLHLAQMIYVEEGEDFIIMDFEGEPGRTPEERLMKEPVLRDIASMIRSFQYLSFMSYMQVHGDSIHATARRLLRSDTTWPWRMRHAISLTLSYTSAILSHTYLHGMSTEELMRRYNEYLLPWIIERGLYEVYYEAMYRPEWIPVPLIGLMNPSIPAYKQVKYK